MLSTSIPLSRRFKCDKCEDAFAFRGDLKTHIRGNHKDASEMDSWNQKLNTLERDILRQNSCLLVSLLNLKEEEEKPICNCKSFCKIKHKFYNWSKPMSVELLKRSRNILEIHSVEHEPMDFQCLGCEKDFHSLGDLENHSLTLHSEDVLKLCSSNPWGLTFFDI